MDKSHRLRKSGEFGHVMRQGESWATPVVVLRRTLNGLPRSRFGFVVGKRVGNAVVRNKVKRRMREAARLTSVEEGWDLVFIARNRAASTNYLQLVEAMGTLLHRARLLKETAEAL